MRSSMKTLCLRRSIGAASGSGRNQLASCNGANLLPSRATKSVDADLGWISPPACRDSACSVLS